MGLSEKRSLHTEYRSVFVDACCMRVQNVRSKLKKSQLYVSSCYCIWAVGLFWWIVFSGCWKEWGLSLLRMSILDIKISVEKIDDLSNVDDEFKLSQNLVFGINFHEVFLVQTLMLGNTFKYRCIFLSVCRWDQSVLRISAWLSNTYALVYLRTIWRCTLIGIKRMVVVVEFDDKLFFHYSGWPSSHKFLENSLNLLWKLLDFHV